jgi:2-(1,2-epoxy-1,2-dihydrophenyl)acetyl-CoA isomerase
MNRLADYRMTMPDIITRVSDRVATLTFNRPDKLNAFTLELIEQSIAALRLWSTDPGVAVIVVTGAGRAFCAGGDVSVMAQLAELTFEQRVDQLRAAHEFVWLLYSVPKVTIASVNGFAMGAGLSICLACDLRIASDQARFGTAWAKIAYGGDFGAAWLLTHYAGSAKAKELLFLADPVDAAEASRLALVNRVVPAESLEAETRSLAARLAEGPLISYRYMKENVNLAAAADLRTVLDREAETNHRCGETLDHKEGVAAFLEKRAARFAGR